MDEIILSNNINKRYIIFPAVGEDDIILIQVSNIDSRERYIIFQPYFWMRLNEDWNTYLLIVRQ